MLQRTRTLAIAAGLAMVVAGPAATTSATDAPARPAATTCADLIVFGVHGMGEAATTDTHNMGVMLGGPDGLYDHLAAKVQARNQTISGDGVDYPTTTISDLKYLIQFGNQTAKDKAKRIDNQVQLGAANLSVLVDNAVRDCPEGDILLAGYSEGAWVVDYFITQHQDLASHLEGVLLFGDPQYRPCAHPALGGCIFGSSRFSGVARDSNLKKKIHSDIPKYLPIPAALVDPGESPDLLFQNTRSYCLSYRGKPSGHLIVDPICGWSFAGLLGLANKDVHITGYHDHLDSAGKSLLDRAADFVDLKILTP